MKKEKVLLYQLRGTETARKLQPVLLRMGIRVKCVEPDEYGLPIGVLAGLEKDAVEHSVDNGSVPVEISAPMMIMCGFSGSRVDELLQQMKRAGVPRIDLKAMLTPTNRYWTSEELFGELQKEHEMMQNLRKQKTEEEK